MSTKACEKYVEEDFSFNINSFSEDLNTGDLLFNISGNPRCERCLYKSECKEKVIDIILGNLEIDEKDISVDEINYN